jgi:hypothetical protein
MKSGGRPTPGRERVATAASRIQDEIAVLHARLQREQAREAREGVRSALLLGFTRRSRPSGTARRRA